MNSKALFAIVVAAAVAAGCATVRTLEATGGSRADGTVQMSYEYGAFQIPHPDWAQANETANQRCAAWGYDSSERFGGEMKRCNDRDVNGNCTRWIVTVTYQCTKSSEAIK